MNKKPLVSIGVPTFNRPKELRNALETLSSQTYANIEIIVSDNCSDNPEVEKVLMEMSKKDNRIRYYIQKENFGPSNNFKFVLEKATGKYFMWASDDDLWKANFIETTTKFLESHINYIAVSMEAQYFSENKFDFFPEGKPFYSFFSDNRLERLSFILKNNYGNLIYGLFRRKILAENDIIFTHNEIPFFLQVFEKGNWKVLSEIGLLKKTTKETYEQAKWEILGGKLINKLNFFQSFITSYPYHVIALKDIIGSINKLSIDKKDKHYLIKKAFVILIRHLFQLTLKQK